MISGGGANAHMFRLLCICGLLFFLSLHSWKCAFGYQVLIETRTLHKLCHFSDELSQRNSIRIFGALPHHRNTIDRPNVATGRLPSHRTKSVVLFLSDSSDDWYADFNPEALINRPPLPNYGNNRMNKFDNNDARSGNKNRGRGDGGRFGRGSAGGSERGGGRIIYERDTSMDNSNVDVGAVERLLDSRVQARRQKDFRKADEIRDQLLNEFSVQVWDKELTWRTGASKSGSGLKRRGNDSRGRERPQRPPKDFGPTGHDYQMSSDAGPIATEMSESEINALIASRLQAKLSKNFAAADQIQAQLADAGVYVHDARKEWRADGSVFGDYVSSDGRPSRQRGSRNDREPPFEQSPYSAGIDSLTEGELADITALISRRNGAKISRDYKAADRIRDELKAEFNIFLDDRLRQWSIGGDFGPESIGRDPSRFKPWTMSSYSEALTSPDHESAILAQLEERNEAKADRNFEAADNIRDFLLSEYNVVIDDRLREWSVGGDFGTMKKKRGNSDGFTRRGGGDLSSEKEAEIIDLVLERAIAKKKRDFETADRLREVLDVEFDVKVDDNTQEWWLKTANYSISKGSARLAEALDIDTQNYIQERLHERLVLKNDKQFDAADEIRDELRERFGVVINDRFQEWAIELDQFTVVDNL